MTGESPLIDTTNASTGDVLDTKSLESIPTPGRSVFLMANLQPTVQTSGNSHWNRMQDQVGNSAVSMGGGPVRANQFLVDGFPVTDLQNRASTNPTIEAIQDMKVQVHTYDSEMGRTGGGVMNMTAKSGANAFHGSGYGVFRPEIDGQPAADSEAAEPAERAGILAQRRRRRRRSDLSRTRRSSGSPAKSTSTTSRSRRRFLVPTAAELGRQLQRRARAAARRSIDQGSADRPAVPRQPDSGQPPEPGRPGDRQVASRPPTSQVDNGNSNFSMTDLLPNQAYQFTTKVDHHFNDAISLSGFVPAPGHARGELELQPGEQVRRRAAISSIASSRPSCVNNTYVLNSSTVLTLRGGYNHFDDNYNLPYAIRRGGAVQQPGADQRRCPTPTGSRRRRSPATRAPASPTGRPTATTSTAATAR